jgi:glycosidase
LRSYFSTWNQPTSNNHYLNGNNYRAVDYSKKSDLNVIDFPMHWNFKNAWDAFNIAKGNDHVYADATWNVTYVDSHDYAPDGAPEGERFNQPQDVWAENLALMFTFRGVPSIYYGSEIEFQKGKRIDVGPNAPLSDTGRAYFGDHIAGSVTATDFGKYTNASGAVANTLNHPLAKHIRTLNLIRHAVPALQKGQYSTDDVSGGLAYKRRFTDSTTDSFALVAVSGGATFNNIPNGTYVDAVTGDTKNVSGGSLSISMSGKGNVRVYVLSTGLTPAPGKVAEYGNYIR